jgi:apolipoprotein N-acyltransferase
MFQRVPNYILAIISGLLFTAGWFAPFTILIFVAWVPLLIIEDKISNNLEDSRKKTKIIWLSYLTFFVWNIGVTWWVSYASFGGACFAYVGNTTFMCVVFMIWHNLKRRINKPWAVWLLIPIWLGYEYGHSVWELTWSWLIMGNAFSEVHNWVQWYEFTGLSGGSLWILVVNILVFNAIKNTNYTVKQIAKPIAALVIPIILSYTILSIGTSRLNSERSYKTLIVQPNVDPYNDKFYFAPEVQLHNLYVQLHGKLDSTIDFLVLPETYLTEEYAEGDEHSSYSLHFLVDSILSFNPNMTIISGANTIHPFKHGEERTASARKYSNADEYFDSFNTGIQLNREGISYYHKSKLVPGAEIMPLAWLLKPLEGFALDLGGTMGTLGTQEERTVFYSHDKKVAIAPVICYESIYSDYVGQYIRNGANLIFIITNDGWWDNTPGHRQHLAYAKLRAIETRREIARCANTGISCFITPYGEIEQATPYWKQALISKNMTPNNDQTLFVKFGDIISYSSSFLAILLFIWSQILRFKKS